MSSVLIIETGVANTASVKSAFSRLGINCQKANSRSEVQRAPAVVLPGVGSFGACRDALREAGIDGAIQERISEDKPTLAICAGFQVLFENKRRRSRSGWTWCT